MSEAVASIVITDADTERGVPTAARCSCGGWMWERPDYDPTAETLPMAARAHRAEATRRP